MGRSLEIMCGACGDVSAVSDEEPGGVYACPQCGAQIRASPPPNGFRRGPISSAVGQGLPVSDPTLSPYWPSTWWGNSLLVAGLAYIFANTAPVSILGGTPIVALAYAVLMLTRYLAVVRRRGREVNVPRRKLVVILRDACFAAVIGCALSAIGSCRNTSAMNRELTAAGGALDETQGAAAEMNSLGYGAALMAESFLRGFFGDVGGAFRRLNEEIAAYESLTDYEGTVRSHMGQIAAKKEAAESQTAWAIVLVVLFLCGGWYCAIRARAPSRSTV